MSQMLAPIRPFDLIFDPEKLREALGLALARIPLHPIYQQIALTHSSRAQSREERAYDGLGTLFDFEKRVYKRDPAEFVIFNEDFKDLYFHEIYKTVCEWSPARLGRVRLMLRKPSSCYSMHADESERYHIAITSNPDCYFFFKGLSMNRIPPDGRLYLFDATKVHTGFNAGSSDRIHLVFDTIAWRFEGAGKTIVVQES